MRFRSVFVSLLAAASACRDSQAGAPMRAPALAAIWPPAPDDSLAAAPLASQLLEEALLAARTPLEAALYLTAWSYASLSDTGAVRDDAPCSNDEPCMVDETLRRLDGLCGYRAQLARVLLGAVGLESRGVSHFDIPVQGGHSTLEVEVAGQWRFFDPYLGLYFASPSDPAMPLSLDEARWLFPAILVMRADVEADGMHDDLRLGRSDRRRRAE